MRHYPRFTLMILVAAALLGGCGGNGDSPLQVTPPADDPPVALTNWSWLNPLPQGAHLGGIAVSGSRAIVVGDDGVVALGDPTTTNWRVVPSPSPGLAFRDVGFVSDDHVVAVGFDGTFRSDDGGETWRSADDTRDLRDLAIRGTRVIAVGTNDVFSPDGISFQQGDYTGTETLRGVAFLDDTTAVAVSSTRIFKSFNAGRNWEELTATGDLTSLRHVAFATRDIGIIAADDPARILRTSDGGATWTEVQRVSNPASDLAFFGTDLGLLMTLAREIYLTFDAGQSWTKQGSPDFDRDRRAAVFLDQNSFIAVGSHGLIERTDNGGQTWNELSTGHRREFIDIAFASPTVAVALAAENDDPFVMRSTDGGVSWSEATAPVDTPRRLKFLNSNLGVLLDLLGEVFKSTDGGVTWTPTGAGPTTQGFRGLALLDADTWLICGQGATVLRTTDGGNNWNIEAFNANGPDYFDLAFFPGTDTGVAVGQDGAARTVNKGNTWSDLGIEAPLGVRAVACASADVAVAVGQFIYRSDDRGKTWAVVGSPDPDFLEAVAFRGELHGLAVGDNAVTFETLDGGLTWSAVETGGNDLRAVAFRDSRSAISAGSVGTLLLGGTAQP